MVAALHDLSRRARGLFMFIVLLLIGCGEGGSSNAPLPSPAPSPPPRVENQPDPAPPPPSVPEPTGEIVFQPCFLWDEGDESHQGTGFFVRGSHGIAAVTSAHFVEFDEARMWRAHWLRVTDDWPVASSAHSWGEPGRAKNYADDFFMLMINEELPEGVTVLEFDERDAPASGERVWFPNKEPDAKLGYVMVQGQVVIGATDRIVIRLDESVPLQSQSGTPFISQKTGKVIGTLAGGHGATIILAPIDRMRSIFSQKPEPVELSKVIGDQSKPAKLPSFVVPTFHDAVPPTQEAKVAEGDFVISSLDWRQIELVPKQNMEFYEGYVRLIRAFKARNFWEDTWTSYWARQEPKESIAVRSLRVDQVSAAVDGADAESVFLMRQQEPRQVKDGFAVAVATLGHLYGHSADGVIQSLSLAIDPSPQIDEKAVAALGRFLREKELLIVDWYRTRLFEPTDDEVVKNWILLHKKKDEPAPKSSPPVPSPDAKEE